MNFVAGNSALSTLAPSAAHKLQHGKSFPKFLEYALTHDGTRQEDTPPAKLAHKLLRTGKPYEIHLNDKWLLVACRSMSDHGAVLTFSDITEMKTRERELAEAKKSAESTESANLLKSQFLATMSHELRTPLNAILGFSEIIHDQILGTSRENWEKYSDYASSIHASGRHLLAVISEILDLSKIEAGTYTLDRQTIDFRPIISEAVRILQPAAQNAGVTICSCVPSERVDIFADERSILQIVLNLLSNATKFTARDGCVDITLSTADDFASLVVEDPGIGIASADQQAVFEPFTQVDASVRRRHDGTGLGLAITKRLVEMHDGSIGLQSELGTGTRLEITLPSRVSKDASMRSAEVAA